ncbi:PAS domain S-box protein [Flectobacillus roseus]|uniref:PAS domain S-box protein n=1 Tax=Flectobacillus roseus TaxID=502259 RepID=UPI0024B7F909|nr:PAS domain S-box protein [Flectobacillus roseus]MDI9868148.1 PAS domain S-box protein [Flectobacillus roseus]
MSNIVDAIKNSNYLYMVKIDLEGFITYVSPYFQKRFEYFGKNLVGVFSLDTVYIDDHQKCAEVIQLCFAEPEKPFPVVLRKPHIANSFLWTQWEFSLQLNDNKEPLEILCIGHDITHVEELNEQTINMNALLLEHQNKYSSLFELSPVGIAVNSMDGHFLEVNTALSNMTGYSKSELLKIDYWTLTPQSYQEQEQEQLRGLHNLGSYGPYEKEYIHKDGHTIPILLNGRLVIDKHGKPRIWSIIQDISKVKEREQIIIDQNSKLKDIAYTQSHVIRHPVANILGAVDLLENEIIPPSIQVLVEMLKISAQQLDDIIRETVLKSRALESSEEEISQLHTRDSA